MRVAVTSVASENLALHNVADPSGWKYFTLQDRVRINEWNPDAIVCLGFFCEGWSDWQAHKATFGDTRRIVMQWIGTDILTLKQLDIRGHKAIIEWLNDDRFLHVAPTKVAMKEMEWSGLKMYGPIDVPAQNIIEPQPQPEKVRLAVYMPSTRQDFYGMMLLKDVLPKIDAEIVFYHWLPCSEEIQYKHECETYFAMTRDDYEEKILKGCSALVRVPVHDSGSISIGEFLMAGKPVVTNQKLPKWAHTTGDLYYEEMGDFKIADGAAQKLEKGIMEIIDLLKNAEKPVSQATMDHYRQVYDPKFYLQKLSEYSQEHWGVPLESASC